ncbi:MAG TPA: hypothetical protein ENN46_04455 [Candidatus Woesearchaeota archaeon]|nr:hypothetical protein [Candidatus Woesearchaeota archaeon]
MPKDDQSIMVVPREALFAMCYFQGFLPHSEKDYLSSLLTNSFFHQRGKAEKNSSLKQPIGYCVIANTEQKKIFAYRRSEKKKHYNEDRLRGRWSIGIGGHIDHEDSSSGDNPLISSVLREIQEEVKINGAIKSITPLGYINDDSDDVGKVHFGVLFLVDTNATRVEPNGVECDFGELMPMPEALDKFRSRECCLENWSCIAFSVVSRILR